MCLDSLLAAADAAQFCNPTRLAEPNSGRDGVLERQLNYGLQLVDWSTITDFKSKVSNWKVSSN